MTMATMDETLESGAFRVRGGTVEIIPSDRENIVKLDFLGDELERISVIDPNTGETFLKPESVMIFPASFLRESKSTPSVKSVHTRTEDIKLGSEVVI